VNVEVRREYGRLRDYRGATMCLVAGVASFVVAIAGVSPLALPVRQ
jgi:hypothetical protein